MPNIIGHSLTYAYYDLYVRTIEAVELLPIIGETNWNWTRPPIYDTWELWSQKGLFGFDWNHCLGQPAPSLPYRLMTRPAARIHVNSLPSNVASYISSVRLLVADFEFASEILV